MHADLLDASSPAALVAQSYALISGRADEPRDWSRFRAMFAPEARLIPVGYDDLGADVQVFDVESYVQSRASMLANVDFFEREVEGRIDRFGDIAHCWSAYEARRSPAGVPVLRGVNSFHLVYRSGRWWILSVFWQNARSVAAISG